MNIVQWAAEHLDYRCLVLPTHLNINGESERVIVSLLPSNGNGYNNRKVGIVLAERKDTPVLEVYLRDIDMVTDCLYYFEYEDSTAMLTIPVPQEEDDGC